MTRSEQVLADARKRLMPANETVLAAVSGGLDSMCLLHWLTDWGAEQNGLVIVAHFNHQLRGAAADRDEAFVRDYCQSRGIPFVSGRGDTRALAREEGLSLEEAARTLRYEFLERTAAERHCAYILTAHHADDSAETLLLNLTRGTGLKGLCGIPTHRGKLLRPFLEVSRRELADYAELHAVPHVEDETNALEEATRNVLRHRVLPVLRELNPRVAESMARTAALLAEDDAALDGYACRLADRAVPCSGGLSLELRLLAEEPPAVQTRAVLHLLERLCGSRKDLGFPHVRAVLDLAGGPEGERTVTLPYGLRAVRRQTCLCLERREERLPTLALPVQEPLRWGDYTLRLLDRVEGEGLALLDARLSVGPCRPADRLALPENRGGRTVKRLCLDRGILPADRDRLPAFYENNRLLAVWRLGVDTAALPKGGSCRFIQIIKHTEESKYEQ